MRDNDIYDRRDFLIKIVNGSAVSAALAVLSACGMTLPNVKSGDPVDQRVMDKRRTLHVPGDFKQQQEEFIEGFLRNVEGLREGLAIELLQGDGNTYGVYNNEGDNGVEHFKKALLNGKKVPARGPIGLYMDLGELMRSEASGTLFVGLGSAGITRPSAEVYGLFRLNKEGDLIRDVEPVSGVDDRIFKQGANHRRLVDALGDKYVGDLDTPLNVYVQMPGDKYKAGNPEPLVKLVLEHNGLASEQTAKFELEPGQWPEITVVDWRKALGSDKILSQLGKKGYAVGDNVFDEMRCSEETRIQFQKERGLGLFVGYNLDGTARVYRADVKGVKEIKPMMGLDAKANYTGGDDFSPQ